MGGVGHGLRLLFMDPKDTPAKTPRAIVAIHALAYLGPRVGNGASRCLWRDVAIHSPSYSQLRVSTRDWCQISCPEWGSILGRGITDTGS